MAANRQIHVFYFIHDLAPFGAQRVALYTVKHMDKKRFRVTVCSFGGEETLAEEFIKYGAEIVFLRARRFFDPFAWIKFVFTLFRAHPQIIQVSLLELSIPARLAALFLPRMAVVHNFQNPASCQSSYWRFLNKITLRMCDAVTFTSRGIADEAAKELAGIKDKVSVIQNGVFVEGALVDNTFELRRELGVIGNEKVIGCVGRLTRQKGQDILIEAMASLAGKGKPVKLIFAGDGEMLPELKEKSKQLAIEENVIFLERRNDIARVLATFDVYAAPSRWEGFNIALGEAMISGKPCVGTSTPGHSELLIDNVTGLTVPVDNPEALAEAIIWILEHPSEAQGMALRAKKRVEAKFTPEIMAKKYENLYLHLTRR